MGSPGPTTPSRGLPGAMPHAHPTTPSNSGPGGGGGGSGGVGGTAGNGAAGSGHSPSSGSGSAGSGVSWRAMATSSTRRHATQSHHDPAGSSSSSAAPSPTSPASFPLSPFHSNGNNSNSRDSNTTNKGHFASSSSSSSPTTSTSASSAFRTPVPKPKKYIGHYDIADRTFQLLSRHRAAACILFWSLTILLDILLQLPIEWFFLFYFILALVFRIFFIGGHIVLISIGAMCVTNAIVFYTVPFSFTSPFATGVAFGLMVSLIHGLNLKGVILAMTMYMLKPYLERQTLIVALNPPTVPSIVFLAPLAAFCSAFGVLWLLYDLFGYLHASTDDLRDFFGITLPSPSIVTLKDVKDRSITLNWQCSSQATISKHLIEIDGLIIGESGKQETSVVIQGLYPENTYRIRLWAITTRNWKTPSDYIIVRTLPSPPVELLELSSVENARRESELAKQAQLQQQTTDATIDECSTHEGALKTEPSENAITTQAALTEKSPSPTSTPTPTPSSSAYVPTPTSPTSAHPTISVESRTSSPIEDVSEEHITYIRKELESKEAAQAVLMQQLADMEKQYRQQEESLKSEILKLREQQKQDDEPRQQAKVKLRELEESLRESEANKSKIEKEHRMEIDKRQRIADQMAVKQRKLDQLQKNLRQSQDKLEAEKASHRQQKQELELSLRKRMEDVAAAEASLKELQETQQSMTTTIEAKEAELQKLQVSLNSPKSLFSWEQKSKDLDLKCTQLTEQLLQYKTENQQLQERLLEASKNVAKVRDEQEARKTTKVTESLPDPDVVAQYSDMYPAQLSHDIGSSWSGGWGQNLGSRVLNGLFQDEVPQERPAPTRRSTGPPPGLPPKAPTVDVTNTDGTLGARGRKDSGSHSSNAEINAPIGHQLKNRQNSGLRPRSSSIMSTESSFMDPANKYLGTESPLPTAASDERFQDTRSRTSSVSSMTGFSSPLFEPSFVYSGQQQQPHSDLGHSPQIHQPHRSSLQRHQLSQSPRTRFQNISQQSPPGAHVSWGSSSPMKTKTAGPVGNRFVSDLDNKAPPPTPGQPFNYHRFFGPTNDSPPGMFSDGTSSHTHLDHQMNEQNVIKSMFEAPEGDLRHQLRTVGSHSSLGTQSKILPSHLRSISTPASSSPLASPTTIASYQQQSPIWDFKPLARPGSLGRMNGQAEGSSTSLNISDTSSPTSPHLAAFTQPPPGFARKPYVKDQSGDRGLWGYETRRNQDTMGFGGQYSDSVGTSGLSFDDRGVPGANARWFNELAIDSEPWAHEARPKRLQNVSSNRESGYSMDSLASPTGSSSSSLDAGTPLSVDAHARVFADQYFSSQRPFETSSSLSGLPKGSDLSKVGRREAKTEPTSTTGGNDIFGYGLNLNPFGWRPADVEANPKSDP